MANLILASEVVSLAFNRTISQTKFTAGLIQAAELRYIKPILTVDLYKAILAAPGDSKYTTLLPMVKLALAYWVKYMALPEIFVEISDTGAHIVNASNAQVVNDQRFIELRDQVCDIAKQHTHLITEYLNENTTLTTYNPGENPQNAVEIAGGILFDIGIDNSEEEDSPASWYQGRGTKGQQY